MPIRIKSLATAGPLWITLTDGAHLRLSPGEVSDELGDLDGRRNPVVEALVRDGLVAVEPVKRGRTAQPVVRKAAGKPK
ncbi:hypothetical protein [Nocardia bovistercoris]|uniref:Uncharacterized protein n=1 Tax=Nocardia bovistercoris TaxID=2785916 RepID=A0A931I7L8_9NOCA|nr:hypothetical protein [Nocardia bovistercoris]MBH0775561.1 hypothetical protein [Nocardia bovistercoris]